MDDTYSQIIKLGKSNAFEKLEWIAGFWSDSEMNDEDGDAYSPCSAAIKVLAGWWKVPRYVEKAFRAIESNNDDIAITAIFAVAENVGHVGREVWVRRMMRLIETACDNRFEVAFAAAQALVNELGFEDECMNVEEQDTEQLRRVANRAFSAID